MLHREYWWKKLWKLAALRQIRQTFLLPNLFTIRYIALITHVFKVVINLLAITVMFSERRYNVDEDAGQAQPVLLLSNPSSTDITVQVRNIDGTATSK